MTFSYLEITPGIRGTGRKAYISATGGRHLVATLGSGLLWSKRSDILYCTCGKQVCCGECPSMKYHFCAGTEQGPFMVGHCLLRKPARVVMALGSLRTIGHLFLGYNFRSRWLPDTQARNGCPFSSSYTAWVLCGLDYLHYGILEDK